MPTPKNENAILVPGEFRLTKTLGDCANAMHIFAMQEKFGYRYKIRHHDGGVNWLMSEYCDSNHNGEYELYWHHQPVMNDITKPWMYNEISINLTMDPLKLIGDPMIDVDCGEEEWRRCLWKDLITIRPRLPVTEPQYIEQAKNMLSVLPRPITLFHPRGVSNRYDKSIPDSDINPFADEIAKVTGGSVAIFSRKDEWDSPIESPNSDRVIHLPQNMTYQLMVELINDANLVVGIDSGPLHLARLTETPTIGLWRSRFCYVTRYTLPGTNRWNLITSNMDDWTDQIDRDLWSIRDGGEHRLLPEKAAALAKEILER